MDMAKKRSTEVPKAAGEAPAKPSRPTRRTYTAEYKLKVLQEVEEVLAAGNPGALGALLRREGLYSSHLVTWRAAREAGELEALAPKKRGRPSTKNPLAEQVAKLQRENARLEERLRKAEIVIDVQKKVAALLGETLPELPEETKS